MDNGSSTLPPFIQSLLAEDTGFQGDEEKEEDDDEDEYSDDSDSFDSTKTDLSFAPSRELANVSDEFCTARNSREQSRSRSITPTNQVRESFHKNGVP